MMNFEHKQNAALLPAVQFFIVELVRYYGYTTG